MVTPRQPTPREPRGGKDTQSDKKGNNCSMCPSNACRSLDFAEGAKKCISLWNSTFDINKLSGGKRVVVSTLRAYSKEHPDATTLKNVDIKITKQEGRGDTPRRDTRSGGKWGGKSRNAGGVTALFDFRELVADGLSASSADFNAMIEELDAESPCIMMLGEASDMLADATLVAEAVVSQPPSGTPDTPAPVPTEEPLAAAAAALEEARHGSNCQ